MRAPFSQTHFVALLHQLEVPIQLMAIGTILQIALKDARSIGIVVSAALNAYAGLLMIEYPYVLRSCSYLPPEFLSCS